MEREIAKSKKKIGNIIVWCVIGILLTLLLLNMNSCVQETAGRTDLSGRLKYPVYTVRTKEDERIVTIDGVRYIKLCDWDDKVSVHACYRLEKDDSFAVLSDYGDCRASFFTADADKRFIYADSKVPFYLHMMLERDRDRIFIRSDCTEEDFIKFVEENTAVAP